MSETDFQNIGVVGLGLIGGSLARAYQKAGFTVYGSDRNKITLDFVRMTGIIRDTLEAHGFQGLDAVFLAVPPQEAVTWLRDHAKEIPAGTLVIDCCGNKRQICDLGFQLMDETEMTFVGGHPMAGRQVWGFKNSRADMFEGADFVIVPRDRSDIRLLERVKALLRPAGFQVFSVMAPEEHDQIIAFTSQLSHIVSSAFIKSEKALGRDAAAAGGSFRDMTRVAYLNEAAWTELFLENRDNLLAELRRLLEDLGAYEKALEAGDSETLKKLLAEGRFHKQAAEEKAEALRKR